MFPALNLPPIEPHLRASASGRSLILASQRRRYVTLTAEEWVRQHFVHFLIEHKGYPAALLGNEISLVLGNTRKRCDSVLYDRQAKAQMIIEYKAPHIPLSQMAFDQISRYNIALHVDYLIISNGIQHYCCRMDYESGGYTFLPDIPNYSEL